MSSYLVIGAGLAAENFIFALSKAKSSGHTVIQLAEDVFYPSCSLRSTAVVAQRGVTLGHSELGDTLVHGYERFKKHIEEDHPSGVYLSGQCSGVTTKTDEFKKRYPLAKMTDEISSLGLHLNSPVCLEEGQCYIINPDLYLSWMRDQQDENIQRHSEVVSQLEKNQGQWEATTLAGNKYRADYVFCGLGSYHRFWKEVFLENKIQIISKPVHGSYLVYNNIHWGEKSFSLTLEGQNLIYRHQSRELVIGSTTEDGGHFMANINELKNIDMNLRLLIKDKTWPSFEMAKIITGIREKSQGRRPFMKQQEGLIICGGYYKNGFSLALYMAEIAIETHKAD